MHGNGDIDASGDYDAMIRGLLRFMFKTPLRNRVPMLPEGYSVHVLDEENRRPSKGNLEDYMLMGAGLARTADQARRLREQHGTDAWGVMGQVRRRKRKRVAGYKRLWSSLKRWLW